MDVQGVRMRVVELAEILSALDEDAALASIESGFRRYSAGETQVSTVLHLGFSHPPGDCHVKGAAVAGDEVFVVKLATSFYRNPELNLPSSNGFMAVLDARTGEVRALLHDQGHLTDLRTAMAGAIAARSIVRAGSNTLGIVGAGTQARLQAKLIKRRLGLQSVLIWARNSGRAVALARELGGEAVELTDLCARSDLIVTTTPSTEPLLMSDSIKRGTRIVAVGADSPGKQELDPRILTRGHTVVDSRAQCIDHGEAGWAVRAGLIDPASLIELGELLSAPIAFGPEEVVVADLTGVAIQDFEIARCVWRALQAGA
jgi:ornithine cyclodeaminase/alanine dehydrogenase-like protein (mu-crystallin family)